ncbi:hypothetical protein LCGC14_1657050 [marine sediment metagenome]|uniref:Uncharacterized protein n=1 Tax=marine sediment metagenome TaxID=412755 RepID=A0A0F9HVT3_9ZZZZ
MAEEETTTTDNNETGTDDELSGNAENNEESATSETTVDDDLSADPDKKGGVQKKIDKLTKKAADAERATAKANQDAAYYKGLAEGKKANDPPAKTTATDPTGLKPEDFNTYEDFVDAKVNAKVDARMGEINKKEEEKEEKEKAETNAKKKQFAEARYAESRKLHDDFDEVVLEPTTIPISQAMMDAATGDNLGEILYVLCKDSEKAYRIMNLPPLQAAREIGKIEAQIINPKKTTKKTTSASDPPTYLGGTNTDQVPDSKKNKKALHEGWEKNRRARIGV